MTHEEKRQYIEAKPFGYASMFGGIEVKAYEWDIYDHVIYTVGAWTGNPTVHRAKIYYHTDRPYFKYNGTRIYFDEIISMSIYTDTIFRGR